MANASILTQITDATNLNTVTIYQPTADCSGYITTLKATVNIKSIAPSNFPYIPDSTPPEATEAILLEMSEAIEYKEISLLLKKGSGSWIERNKIRLFNKDPYYDIDIMAYLTDANTVDVAEDLAIGLRINEALVDGDYITIFGFAVEEKKTDDLEAALARIEALELALHGRITGLEPDQLLGSGAEGGVAAPIPQSNFVDVSSNQSIGGVKTFTSTLPASSTTSASVVLNGGLGVNGNAYIGPEIRAVSPAYPKIVLVATSNPSDLKKFQMFITPTGDFFFAPLNDAENISNGAFIISNNGGISFPSLPASAAGLSAGSLWRNGNVVNIV